MKNPSPFEARGRHGDRIAKRGKRQDGFTGGRYGGADPRGSRYAVAASAVHLTMRAERLVVDICNSVRLRQGKQDWFGDGSEKISPHPEAGAKRPSKGEGG